MRYAMLAHAYAQVRRASRALSRHARTDGPASKAMSIGSSGRAMDQAPVAFSVLCVYSRAPNLRCTCVCVSVRVFVCARGAGPDTCAIVSFSCILQLTRTCLMGQIKRQGGY